MAEPLEENLVALEFAPEIPCEIPGHATGKSPRCNPLQDARHYAELSHTIPEHGNEKTIIAICSTQAAYIRIHAEEIAGCPSCGFRAPFREFIRYVGPLGQLPTDK